MVGTAVLRMIVEKMMMSERVLVLSVRSSVVAWSWIGLGFGCLCLSYGTTTVIYVYVTDM